MGRILVLDTHALIWFLQGDSRLGLAAQAAIADAESSLVIPAIVLAEAMWIVERGRTNIPSPAALLETINADPRFRVLPLDQAILERTISLTAITEMHDRQIVASALSLITPKTPAMLISTDHQIRDSGLVPMLW